MGGPLTYPSLGVWEIIEGVAVRNRATSPGFQEIQVNVGFRVNKSSHIVTVNA